MHFPNDSLNPAKRVVIPMQVHKGVLVPFHNMSMPQLKDGSVVDLVCEESQFVESDFAARLNTVETVLFLKKGATLFAHMRQDGPAHREILRRQDVATEVPMDHATFFIPFTLQEDLMLELRGTRKPALCDCACDLGTGEPEFTRPGSVNQAYTRISEKHEISRRSHTGNVFEKVLYMGEDGIARPLAALRDQFYEAFINKLFPPPPKVS
ncbi:MAG: hypothetical protein NTY98_08870 [Verrucomicrobia bacterium]|nr:hypothetical protein [Verrucomicrobiota bacterium]